jgi:cutinase
MAYTDAGAGEPVLLLHAIPTWSFLYADAIPLLEPHYTAAQLRLPTRLNGPCDGYRCLDSSVRAKRASTFDVFECRDSGRRTDIVCSAAPASALTSCPGAEVVFARGTDEPPGIGRVGQALVDSLRTRLGDEQVAVYAVDYPATHDFMKAVDGATDARARVEATAASCPSTKIVLGGYSQGAAVIDLITGPEGGSFGFVRPLPANVADRVAAVTVFGNPLNRFGRPLTAWSPVYGVKTIDLCNGADPRLLWR